jgi:hypothetical protein
MSLAFSGNECKPVAERSGFFRPPDEDYDQRDDPPKDGGHNADYTVSHRQTTGASARHTARLSNAWRNEVKNAN